MTEADKVLFKAAADNDTAAISKAITSGASLHTVDEGSRTALLVATYQNNINAALQLIDAGSDVNAQDHIQESAFLHAGAKGYVEILRRCMSAGARYDVYNRFGGTALIPACERAHIPVVEAILTDIAFPVNHINNLGWTALMEAVILGDGEAPHIQVVKLLLAAHADVNIPDKKGITPYQHAVQLGYKEMAALLQAAGGK